MVPTLTRAPCRYVDRVTEFLLQKLKQSQLLALKKELMVQKQQEALQEQAALEPKLDLLLEKTRELQTLVSRGAGPAARPARLRLRPPSHCLTDRSRHLQEVRWAPREPAGDLSVTWVLACR